MVRWENRNGENEKVGNRRSNKSMREGNVGGLGGTGENEEKGEGERKSGKTKKRGVRGERRREDYTYSAYNHNTTAMSMNGDADDREMAVSSSIAIFRTLSLNSFCGGTSADEATRKE